MGTYPIFVKQNTNTMTQAQALAALEALTKQNQNSQVFRVSKNSSAYRSAVEAIMNPGKEIIVAENTGSGRFSGSRSWKIETVSILTRAGIPAIGFNVAPRGGRSGDRVSVAANAFDK